MYVYTLEQLLDVLLYDTISETIVCCELGKLGTLFAITYIYVQCSTYAYTVESTYLINSQALDSTLAAFVRYSLRPSGL